MSTVTTPNQPFAWRPDIVEYLPDETVPDALILKASTRAGVVEGDEPAVRVPYVKDDGDYGFVPEGDQIGDVGQQFDQVTVTTGKIAAVGNYSFEALQQPHAARLIVNSLNRGITAKANAAFLTNDPQAGDDSPKGLVTDTADITDGGAIGTNLDTLTDAVSGIEAAGSQANLIIAGPDAWADLAKLKTDSSSEQTLLGAGTAPTERSLLGVPVLVSSAMHAGGLVVMDTSAVVSAFGQVRVARSDHAQFAHDSIAIRITWRLGWKVMYGDRVVYLGAAEES